jgi:hypothetical protein
MSPQEQDGLWGNEYVRRPDPDTSHEAARAIEPNLALDRAECLGLIKLLLGASGKDLTRKEFRDRLIEQGFSTLRAESLRRRISDLIKLEYGAWLIVTGKKRDGSQVLILNPYPGEDPGVWVELEF